MDYRIAYKSFIKVNIKMVAKLVNGIFLFGEKICKYILKQYYSSGGGAYDEQSNGMKIGEWIELSDGFSLL